MILCINMDCLKIKMLIFFLFAADTLFTLLQYYILSFFLSLFLPSLASPPISLPLRFVLLLYLNTVRDMLFDSIIVQFSCLAV